MLELPAGGKGYFGTEPCVDLAELRTPFAFLGVPFGPPYVATDLIEGSDAPAAIRAVTSRFFSPAEEWSRYDFDFGRALFPDGAPNVTDVGDVACVVRDIELTKRRITAAVRGVLDAGAIPIVQGGLDNLPPLVAAAYEGREIGVLQIDAHLDYRDEVGGIRDGYSSPMRRVRELPFVRDLVQLGLRGRGSAGVGEVEQAVRDGNVLITAAELRRRGIDDVIAGLPERDAWLVSLDCDGLDPSVAPGVYAKAVAGVSFDDAFALLSSLSRAHTLCGLIVTEFMPDLDVGGITALTIARLQEAVLAHW